MPQNIIGINKFELLSALQIIFDITSRTNCNKNTENKNNYVTYFSDIKEELMK